MLRSESFLDEKILLIKEEGSNIPCKTGFFRDELVFNILKHIIMPYYDGRQANFASVGCSIGCEAYSILLQNWDRRDFIFIDGFDIYEYNIDKCRQGEYDLHDDLIKINELGLMENKVKPYEQEFIEGRLVRIIFNDNAKKHVNFSILDVVKNPLPKKYDIIFLANVLYYYEEKAREMIVSNISESLADEGWLLCESKNGFFEDDIDVWMNNLEEFFLKKQNLAKKSQVYKKISD